MGKANKAAPRHHSSPKDGKFYRKTIPDYPKNLKENTQCSSTIFPPRHGIFGQLEAAFVRNALITDVFSYLDGQVLELFEMLPWTLLVKEASVHTKRKISLGNCFSFPLAPQMSLFEPLT